MQAIQERFFSGGYEFKREHDAVQHGSLMREPVTRETRRKDCDEILGHGVHRYVDGGWEWVGPLPGQRPIAADPENRDEPPVCSAQCRYRQSFGEFSLQRNALRSELASMIATDRCGWNIKPGRIGGRPLDYDQCVFVEIR